MRLFGLIFGWEQILQMVKKVLDQSLSILKDLSRNDKRARFSPLDCLSWAKRGTGHNKLQSTCIGSLKEILRL